MKYKYFKYSRYYIQVYVLFLTIKLFIIQVLRYAMTLFVFINNGDSILIFFEDIGYIPYQEKKMITYNI